MGTHRKIQEVRMSIVIIGGHDRMVCQYKKVCQKYQCKAKVFTQMSGNLSLSHTISVCLIINENYPTARDSWRGLPKSPFVSFIFPKIQNSSEATTPHSSLKQQAVRPYHGLFVGVVS